jgi:hypothetical protein
VLADGTTVTLPDTEENQVAYPQPSSQRKGLGFPQMRLVALPCLASGALLDAAEGPCKGKGSDEQTLFRGLLGNLREGDVLLGDAYFPTWFLLYALRRLGIDGVLEQYGARKRSTNFNIGTRLGTKDHVRPKPERPDWMSPQAYAAAPANLTVRELHTGGKTLVTTFLCPKDTPKGMLKALYGRRWQVALDVRNIKTTLGMQTLRCRTPEMARKALWSVLAPRRSAESNRQSAHPNARFVEDHHRALQQISRDAGQVEQQQGRLSAKEARAQEPPRPRT